MGIGISGAGSTTQPLITVNENDVAKPPDTSAGSISPASCFAPADGPSGTVDSGGVSYVCKDGKVFVGDSEVGTVNDAGDYSVTLKGADGSPQTHSGSVGQLIGASVHGELSDGTDVDIDSVGATESTPTKITCAGPEEKRLVQGRELKPNEGIDPFGNLVLHRLDEKGKRTGSYMILEHAPANLGSGNATCVAQSYNTMYPEKCYREFSDGTRVPWDGKIPELAKTASTLKAEEEAAGPAPASKAVVEGLKKAYLAATGVPLNQGQLEMVGYTQALKNPEYLEVLKKQGEAVNAVYEKALGRPPSTAERLYWVNLSTDLDLMKRGLDSINNPYKNSKEYLSNISAGLAKHGPTVNAGLTEAGDLPAIASEHGRRGAESEQAIAKERRPLANPFEANTAQATAFEKLRTASKLRGVDITDNVTSAHWARQMVETGTASNPAFFKTIDDTIAAVRTAYQRHLNRAPTKDELAEWLPMTANQQYNERRASEVLAELQNKGKIDAVTDKIRRR